jgi:chromosome segregation ATPase
MTTQLKARPSDDALARIIAAAQAVWAENGNDPTNKPRLPEVRQRARADMNATALVLNEWWREQVLSAPKAIAIPVPQTVMDAFMPVLAMAWQTCQQEANANLAAAQTNWERERAMLEDTRQELSDLWEGVSQQLSDLGTDHAAALRDLDTARVRASDLDDQVVVLREKFTAQVHLTEQAVVRLEEVQRRADELKGELSLSHQEAQEVRDELRQSRVQHHENIKQAEAVAALAIEAVKLELATYRGRTDALIASQAEQIESAQVKFNQQQDRLANLQEHLATAKAEAVANEKSFQARKQEMADAAHKAGERFTQLQAEREDARRLASEAENHASHLAGKLESLEAQNKSLLVAISKPSGK